MIAYFDASAILKLVLREEASAQAHAIWDSADVLISSVIAYPEGRAALAAAVRDRRLRRSRLPGMVVGFDARFGQLYVLDSTAALGRVAGVLAGAHVLTGCDAVHLASALAAGDPEIIVVTWDRRLAEAAQAEGLRTAGVSP